MVARMQTMELPLRLRDMLDRALKNPEGFWGEAATELHWFKRWNRVLEWNYPEFKWFSGGLTNLSYNALDRHVLEGKGERPALIWESGETGESRILTYGQLFEKVRKFAAALRALGVGKGDRVTIYMPMVP